MKRARHKAILDLVRTREIYSQDDLMRELQARNIEVSQSTLSRDIQELRLAKTAGVYTVVDVEPLKASQEDVRRIIREFLVEIATAENLVVLKTGPGNASTLSQAIDDADWPEVVGDIAGENTIFIATRSARDARKIEDRLRAILE
jgi:transcriptional regulator of arginine metabolism